VQEEGLPKKEVNKEESKVMSWGRVELEKQGMG
jgi:hypothetical protein